NPRGAETAGGTRGACFYKGELYDNIFTRLRGGTARSWPKKSFKVEFPEDHHFKFDPELPRVDEFNLNATYTDKSYARAILTTELHQDAGSPSPETFPLRVHQNGAFYSVALFVEQCDRDFLRRNDLDTDGAYYKANPGSFYTSTGSFEKKTRQDEGKEDVTAFIDGLKLKGADLESFLMDHVDIPAQISFMVSVAITQNIDDSDKNHFLYRDTEGSGEWFMTPWDLDLTFGPDALNTDVIIADENRNGASNPNAVHPFIGSRKFPLAGGKTNEFLDRMFITSRTQDMFLRRLRTLHDEFLATDYFDRRLDELVALFEKDTVEDNEKWGTQSHFGGRRDGMAVTIDRIKTEYLVPRRDFFERGGLVGIPASMPADPSIDMDAIELAPVSGNEDEEYLVLKNPNRFAVDLSGWRLEGGIEHTFRPGTVLLPGSLFSPGRNVFYVVKDTVAFRARAEGPSGGQGLCVQGNYRGRLSNEGEEIRLVDGQDRLVTSKTYEGVSDAVLEVFGTRTPMGNFELVRDGETFTYELVYGVEVVEGFEFEVEHSSDLEEWIASEASPDLSEDGKLRILLTSPDQKRFVRVRVKRAE
ncbi:MAG: CotH kinase family protein, partial [Verrucomicrobiales bacterium]